MTDADEYVCLLCLHPDSGVEDVFVGQPDEVADHVTSDHDVMEPADSATELQT